MYHHLQFADGIVVVIAEWGIDCVIWGQNVELVVKSLMIHYPWLLTWV
jgi:hypothetical protein